MKLNVLLLILVLSLRAQSDDLVQSLLTIQNAIEGGDLAKASRLIDDELAQHWNDGGLINLRGVVKARSHDVTGARQDFEEAVRWSPALIPAWQNLARACTIAAAYTPADASCAIRAWQRVLRAKPSDAEAHASLAQLFLFANNFNSSLAEIAQLPASDAGTIHISLIRCFDLASVGRIAEAKSLAAKVASRKDYSETDLDGLESFLDLDKPDLPKSDRAQAAEVVVALLEPLGERSAASPAALERLAVAQERLNRPADATRTLERLAALEPSNPAHLLELARLAEAGRHYEAALGYLAHARDLAPNNPQIHFLFAMTAAAMQLPVEARRSLDRALELDPQNPDYNYAMGSVILATRDAATASTYFERFVKAHPNEPRGHYALGIAYFAGGDYERAKKEMQGVAGQPNTAAGAEYFLGRMARLDGDTAAAYGHLGKSIALIPTYSESHTELARVYLLDGKMDQAHAELEKALQLDPQSFQGNNQLLVYYRRTNDSRAAQQEELLKKLDEDRSRRSELMLRTVEVRP